MRTASNFRIISIALLVGCLARAAEDSKSEKPSAPSSAVPAKSALEKALEFSTEGVGLYFLVGKGDNLDNHRSVLKKLLEDLKADHIPTKVAAAQRGVEGTHLIFFVDYKSYQGGSGPAAPDAAGGYSVEDIQTGRVRADISKFFNAAKATRIEKEAKAAALRRKLEDLNNEIAAIDKKIGVNEAKIASNNVRIAENESLMKRFDAIAADLKAGKLPSRNPDGSLQDQELEKALVALEKSNQFDRSNPEMMRAAFQKILADLKKEEAAK